MGILPNNGFLYQDKLVQFGTRRHSFIELFYFSDRVFRICNPRGLIQFVPDLILIQFSIECLIQQSLGKCELLAPKYLMEFRVVRNCEYFAFSKGLEELVKVRESLEVSGTVRKR